MCRRIGAQKLELVNRARGPAIRIPRRRIFYGCYNNYHLTNNLTHLLQKVKMPREAEISLNEREFIKQALQEQIRIDRRAFDAFRPLELTFGEEYGVADVQLGKTRYMIYWEAICAS